MRFLNLVSVAISCATAVSALAAIKTPSGYDIPTSLLSYLDCPIGDIICKQNKVKLCKEADAIEICKNSDLDAMIDALYDNEIEIGDLTPEKFCKVQTEVCNMIEDYNPPLTLSYIYDLDKYFTCDDTDAMCIHGKNISCSTVLKSCWGNYPNKACQKLSNACSKLSDMDTIKEPVKENL